MEIKKYFNKKSQIWVETVIYTLIALVLIAAVLAFARPKLQEMQDKATIEESLSIFKDIDLKMQEVVGTGSGNKRVIGLIIQKGKFEINGLSDSIIFTLESHHQYGEIGAKIPEGRDIFVTTENNNEIYTVTIKKDYSEKLNLTILDKDEIKTLDPSTGNYEISILNNGRQELDSKTVIEFEVN